MGWTIAPALITLRDEVNSRWPNRDKASDGFIGDTAHAATASDHNPNAEDVVCAFDITHDPDNGPDIAVLFEQFRTNPHPDCKYLIANRQIASRTHDWIVRAYSGDPHTNHLHVSVGVGSDGQSAPGTYDDTSSWFTGIVAEQHSTPAVITLTEDDSVRFHYAKPDNDPGVYLVSLAAAPRHVTLFHDAEYWATEEGHTVLQDGDHDLGPDSKGDVRKGIVLDAKGRALFGLA